MAGTYGGLLGAGIIVLTLAATGCGYDRSSNPTGPGYGDTSALAPRRGSVISAAEGRSRFRVFTATGDIAARLAEFRTALGDPLNLGTPGPLAGGRREIKWDAVPADQLNVSTFPGDFFNTRVTAGAIFSTDGSRIAEQQPGFQRHQPGLCRRIQRLQPAEDLHADRQRGADRQLPRSRPETPAATRGFGVVFSDVERQGAASIKLFDAEGRSLGQYHAPVRTDAAGFSFVGVVFESPIVAEVRITSGQRALGAGVQDLSDGGNLDLAVMDDYLYAEPQAIR